MRDTCVPNLTRQWVPARQADVTCRVWKGRAVQAPPVVTKIRYGTARGYLWLGCGDPAVMTSNEEGL
jgi:hypothetical protein